MVNSYWRFWLTAIVVGCSRPEPTAQNSSRLSTLLVATSSPATMPTNGPAAVPPASEPSTPPAVPRRAPCELLAIGDSLTDPKSGGGGYLEGVQNSCDCRVTNLGRGGDMVNQMRTRLLAHLAEPPVDYRFVVVFGGVNDLYSDLTAKRSVEKISIDLEKMYRAASAAGARVVAVTVAPWGGFRRYFTEHRWQNTQRLNAWIRDSTARGLTDAVVDAESLLSCGAAERLCDEYAAPYRDGLHFGPGGHRRLSAALTQSLGPSQCSLPPDRGPDGP